MKHIKLFESFTSISENLKYHIDNNIPVLENVFRPHSESFYNLIRESRELFDSDKIEISEHDKHLFETTDLGYFGIYEGQTVPLDLPIENILETNQPMFSIHDVTPDFKYDVMGKTVTNIVPTSWVKNGESGCMSFEGEVDGQFCICKYDDGQDGYVFEAKSHGKNVKLNSPMRSSGPKKYKVYVRNPKTGNIKQVNFGDAKGGLSAKVSNPKARKSFAARHQCHLKKNKLTPGYWSCRANRYASLWNGRTYPGYW
jgi:hypothetical protein